jgi:hypothetical protein
MLQKEQKNPQYTYPNALFLAVKIVHEVSHLLHYHLYLKVKGELTTPKKDIKETVKTFVNKKVDTKENVTEYDDFGELMEIKLFGGLIECKSSRDEVYMGIDSIVCYPSRSTLFGNFVCVDQTIAAFEENQFNFVLGEEYQAKQKPCFQRVDVKSGNVRSSRRDDDVYDRGTETRDDVSADEEEMIKKLEEIYDIKS